jgi:hypothetical protein
LTIDTTILVSTSSLSNVNSLPETLAIYRSSVGQSNVVFEYVAWGFLDSLSGEHDKKLKTCRNHARGPL